MSISAGRDLEEVVHDEEAGEAGLVGRARDLPELRPELSGTPRPGEDGDLEPDAHDLLLLE
jgi:hypothetical protein